MPDDRSSESSGQRVRLLQCTALADLIPGSGAMVYVRDVGLVVGGAAFTGLAAQISFTIPSISQVPYTLQTFAVFLRVGGRGGLG